MKNYHRHIAMLIFYYFIMHELSCALKPAMARGFKVLEREREEREINIDSYTISI